MANVKISVHNPIGTVEVSQMPAPRTADLHGKKIGMVWNGVFRGDESFPFLQQLLQERFPDTTILAHDQLPESHPTPEAIAQVVKEKGLDAVIGGNGG